MLLCRHDRDRRTSSDRLIRGAEPDLIFRANGNIDLDCDLDCGLGFGGQLGALNQYQALNIAEAGGRVSAPPASRTERRKGTA